MRTTIRLPDELLREAKAYAARSGRTLTGVISDALRRELQGAGTAPPAGPLQLHTVGGNGLQPGVDLDDSAALLDLMDEPRATP